MSRTPPPPQPRSLLYAWRELEFGYALCCRRRRVPLDEDGEDLDDQAERWLWIQRPTVSSYEIPGGWAYPEAEVPAEQNLVTPLVNENIIAPYYLY